MRTATFREGRERWLANFLERTQNVELSRAALVIQTSWRLYRTSAVIQKLLIQVNKRVEDFVHAERSQCALTIQCAVRQWIARRKRREKWELLCSVRRCQAVARMTMRTRRARRTVAAKRIQRTFRFYWARKRARAMCEARTHAQAEAWVQQQAGERLVQLQAVWRGQLVRRWILPVLEHRRGQKEDRDLAEVCIDAALCIQSAFRARLARRLRRRLISARNHLAAAKIQSVWRGRIDRRKVTDFVIFRNRTLTALVLRLQTFWRCYIEAREARTHLHYSQLDGSTPSKPTDN